MFQPSEHHWAKNVARTLNDESIVVLVWILSLRWSR